MKFKDFSELSRKILEYKQAKRIRDHIKFKLRKPRTYLFNIDYIKAPIVGSVGYNFAWQFKWESKKSEDLLNSRKVLKK